MAFRAISVQLWGDLWYLGSKIHRFGDQVPEVRCTVDLLSRKLSFVVSHLCSNKRKMLPRRRSRAPWVPHWTAVRCNLELGDERLHTAIQCHASAWGPMTARK